MTAEMMDAEHEGDASLCKPISTKDERKEYCDPLFGGYTQDYEFCMDREVFCYMCCMHEFGELHEDDRAHCIDNCDSAFDIPEEDTAGDTAVQAATNVDSN